MWLDKEDKIRKDLFDLLQVDHLDMESNQMGLHAVNSFSLAIRPGLLVSGSSELLETAFSGHMLMIASQFPLSLQNIVLIRDPEDSRKFYPRFNLEDTSSFKDLDEHRYFYHAILHEPVVFFFQCSQEQISIH